MYTLSLLSGYICFIGLWLWVYMLQFQVYGKLNQLYISIYPLFFQILFPCMSLQSIDQTSCAIEIEADIYALCCVVLSCVCLFAAYRLQPTRLCGIFQARILGTDSHFLLHGICSTEWNPSLFHLLPSRQILYHRTIWEALIYTYLPYIKQESIS